MEFQRGSEVEDERQEGSGDAGLDVGALNVRIEAEIETEHAIGGGQAYAIDEPQHGAPLHVVEDDAAGEREPLALGE